MGWTDGLDRSGVLDPPGMAVLEQGPEWIALAKEGVVFMRLDGPLTIELVDVTKRMRIEALRQRPAGLAIILDIGSPPALPTSDVRDYAAREAGKHSEGILAHATILSGGGFWGSAIRSALTGIFLVARSPYPRVVVGSPGEAFQFVRAKMGSGAPTTASMQRALDLIREKQSAQLRTLTETGPGSRKDGAAGT